VRLAWLELTDFRSYVKLDFVPAEGVNVLVGHNGAGKTNVLEAIAYLSGLRSLRSAPDTALVRVEAAQAVIRGGFIQAAGEAKVEVAIPASGRRRVLFNGKRPARFADVPAAVPVVAFLPDDLDLVKRGPALRRDYLDDLGAHLTPTVGADHADYVKILRQRNSLLRRDGRSADRLTLDVWDERLAEAGARVFTNRLRLLDRLGPIVAEAYHTVGGGADTLTWDYRAGWSEGSAEEAPRAPTAHAAQLRRALSQRRERDLDQRTTTAGPHRDEPILRLSSRDARTGASQGEQRSTALALRLAAYTLLESRHGQPPVLLLDDVFSELDPARSKGVMDLLPRGQVFVTTAREDEVPVSGTTWLVGGGAVDARAGTAPMKNDGRGRHDERG
jgi:DNA replication and repair protein RecF